MKNEKDGQEYLFAPLMKEYFQKKKENEALIWIPVQCSLLFSDEFRQISPINRCIFVSFLLLCGLRGSFEIPFRINYLADTLGINKKTLMKGIDELTGVNLLHKREREKEKKERTAQTDREITPNGGAVSVDFSDFEIGNTNLENESTKDQKPKTKNQKPKSQFTIAECLKYVEICKQKGDDIKNVKGLANHLFKTGESDAFILATLYPEKQEDIDRETYGEPVQFTDEPCAVCFGAKMAEVKGKGFQKCQHCQNEKGKATGYEPLEG